MDCCKQTSVNLISQQRNHSNQPHGKRSIFSMQEKNKIIQFTNFNRMMNNNNNNIRHIASQTIFREGSTQTDPFSPVFTISSGEHPEVFTLSDFTYGKGLPATSVEISFIERLRARREWEHDRTIDMTRTKLVIERELREWQLREKEIQMFETAREKFFIRNLHQYIDTDEDLTQTLMNLAVFREENRMKLYEQRLQRKTSRDIRRLYRSLTSNPPISVIGTVKNTNGCIRILKPAWHTRSKDIFTEFQNRFSKMSSECPALDCLIDQRMKQSQMDIFQLEKYIPEIHPMKNLISVENCRKKKLQRRIGDLQRASQLIEEKKNKYLSSNENKPLRFMEKIETIDHIQPLPTTPIQTETHDHRQQTLIQFQNYLRCITVRSRIDHVYEIREDLLEELRRGLNISVSDENSHQSISTNTSEYLIDATIGDMLDFLSKELQRLQREQSIHLFLILADRCRYQREAAETGARTRAIELQQDCNCDIDNYLQDLIGHSIDKTADEQARLEIEQLTETLLEISSHSDPDSFVSDLVHNSLLPIISKLLSHAM